MSTRSCSIPNLVLCSIRALRTLSEWTLRWGSETLWGRKPLQHAAEELLHSAKFIFNSQYIKLKYLTLWRGRDRKTGSDLHSSYRPGSGLDNGSTWRSWTQRPPSLSPPYSLCTEVEHKQTRAVQSLAGSFYNVRVVKPILNGLNNRSENSKSAPLCRRCLCWRWGCEAASLWMVWSGTWCPSRPISSSAILADITITMA